MIACNANIHSDIVSLGKDKSGILLLEKSEEIKLPLDMLSQLRVIENLGCVVWDPGKEPERFLANYLVSKSEVKIKY